WGTLEEVAALLFRHIGQLVCNGYAIYQVLPSPALQNNKDPLASGCSIESLSQERLASAIFATASLMNHSCKPTTINSYVGNLLVIRNLEEVAPGQKVYSCYGPHYSRHTRAERQSLLQQQYHFTRNSIFCSLFTYTNCAGVSSLEKKDCDVRLVVKKLQRALRSAERVYGVENQFLGSIQDTYAMALSALGSFEASTNILKKSVLKVGRRYGQRSVELGHEIIKLCGVIKQRMQHIEDTSSLLYRQLKREHYYMSDIVTTIFTVIYGEDWQTILNVQI
ncbi:SET and MYND domain-containing protein 4, partial [Hyalella azteca]|uniref:SET and MYND domain-containing protein 4 n=1 Tax=Hyalella azteca TaxID=294128 RepID=A0A979FXD1_HYAAZ